MYSPMTAALILFLLGGFILWFALRLRRQTGIPWVRVVSSDTNGWLPLERPLFARAYGLTGKPDYLLKLARAYVPVEVKPTRRAAQPYASDLMQLAAYCLLVEVALGQSPPYGLLRYAETTFRINYTPSVRAELLATLDDMRADLAANDCARSHNEPRRCAGCGFLEVCDEALFD